MIEYKYQIKAVILIIIIINVYNIIKILFEGFKQN